MPRAVTTKDHLRIKVEYQLAQSRSDNNSDLDPRYQEKLERDRQLKYQRDSSSQQAEPKTTQNTAQANFIRCPVKVPGQ